MMSSEKKYWNRWYAIVLLFLLFQVVFYYFLSVYFNGR